MTPAEEISRAIFPDKHQGQPSDYLGLPVIEWNGDYSAETNPKCPKCLTLLDLIWQPGFCAFCRQWVVFIVAHRAVPGEGDRLRLLGPVLNEWGTWDWRRSLADWAGLLFKNEQFVGWLPVRLNRLVDELYLLAEHLRREGEESLPPTMDELAKALETWIESHKEWPDGPPA